MLSIHFIYCIDVLYIIFVRETEEYYESNIGNTISGKEMLRSMHLY